MQKSLVVDTKQKRNINQRKVEQKVEYVNTEARKILRKLSGVAQARKLQVQSGTYIILVCSHIIHKNYVDLLVKLQKENCQKFVTERNIAHSYAAIEALKDPEANPFTLLDSLRNKVPQTIPWTKILNVLIVLPNWEEAENLELPGFSETEIKTLQQHASSQKTPTKLLTK